MGVAGCDSVDFGVVGVDFIGIGTVDARVAGGDAFVRVITELDFAGATTVEVAVCLIGFAVVFEACSVVFVFWSVEIDVEVSTSTPVRPCGAATRVHSH